jgi:NTP pyrophosphatase (non-canonical NTP hydrolase)
MDNGRTDRLDRFQRRIGSFIAERDWEKFHRPKDVAMALSIESAEIMELYLWDRRPEKEELEDEIADVLFFLLDLATREGIDLEKAFERKMGKNEAKYPASVVQGKDLKYDRYPTRP